MNFSMASRSQHRSGKNKSNPETGRDRISSLPDILLVHILSFLPTTISFRTSVLSTRWQYLWTLVPVLDFSPYFTYPRKDPDSRFMNFIQMILLQHSKNVKRFFIQYPREYDCSRLYTWTNALLKHNIQHVDIFCSGMNFRLPRNFFICKTLERLKLECQQLYVPSSIHFPCLKILFVRVDASNRDFSERLFCSAPMLEELSIFVTSNNGAKIYNISSSYLKKLIVEISAAHTKHFDIKVTVDAPALETLDIMDNCFGDYVLKNSSSLVKAEIGIGYHYHNDKALENKFISEKLIMLLKSVSNVKDLSLFSMYPLPAFLSIYEGKWPVFANTALLVLDIIDEYDLYCSSRWALFPDLKHILALVPNLTSLVFVNVGYFEKPGQFNPAEQWVPSCFRSCLREVEIRRFKGLKSELGAIKYMLKNAMILEKMTITIVGQRNPEELVVEILKMPKCSKHAELVFI